MKTAMELELIKALVIKEEQKREVERIAELHKEHEKIIANTILFCEENLAIQLEERALRGLDIKVKLQCQKTKDELGNELLFTLKHDGQEYASGEKSLRPAAGPYDITTIEEYLAQFFFSTSWERNDFRTYGKGYSIGYNLKIETTLIETPQ